MSGGAFAPEQEITATLQAQEWNLVYAGLQELPYRVSNLIINKLRQQMIAPPGPMPSFKPEPAQQGNGQYKHLTPER